MCSAPAGGLSGSLISDMVGMSKPMVERFSAQRENAVAGVIQLQNVVRERNERNSKIG
jgi:hypothetical protein